MGFHGSFVRASLASHYPAIAGSGQPGPAQSSEWCPKAWHLRCPVPLVGRRPGLAGDAEPEIPALCRCLGPRSVPFPAARPPSCSAVSPSAGRKALGLGKKFAEAGGTVSTLSSLSSREIRGPGAPRWVQARGPPTPPPPAPATSPPLEPACGQWARITPGNSEIGG